jgi:nucleotide-binding universal stress UspA family protein
MKAAVKTLDAKTKIALRNILFATDFSPAADFALPYAVEVARRYGAKVIAVHVKPAAMYAMVPPAGWAALADAAKEVAKEEAERLERMFPGVENKVVIGEGDIWGVLSRMIEENDIDLLVIGTHGRTGFKKALLGSIAEEIFRQAPCPVLTVGPRAPGDPEQATEAKEILFATDFSPGSLAAAPYAISLAQEHQARLVLLHVVHNPRTGELMDPQEFVVSSLRRLQALVPPEAELWCEPSFVVEQGVPAEKTLEIAKQRHADLIVLGVRHAEGHLGASTHLPWATAHQIVTRAACPVLTVRG